MGEQVHSHARGSTGGMDVAEVLPRDGFLPAPLPSPGEPLARRAQGQQGPMKERLISTPGSPQQGCPPALSGHWQHPECPNCGWHLPVT